MTTWIITRAARMLVRNAYRSSFAHKAIRRALSGKIVVLLYHRIADHDDAPWLEASGLPYTTPKAFREHLQLLSDLGTEFLTLDDLDPNSGIQSGKWNSVADDRPRVVVTFDDGYVDNFTVAAPILEEFDARGVFFITTSLPDKAILLDHRLAWLNSTKEGQRCIYELVAARLSPSDLPSCGPLWAARQLLTPVELEELVTMGERQCGALQQEQILPTYGTWDQIATAAQRGHQIGAHSVSHQMRFCLSAAEFSAEAVESKQRLEAHLGREIAAFSYPFNAYLFSDELICREAGFRQVATVDPGLLDPKRGLLNIPRRTVFCIHDSLNRFRELLLDPGFSE